MLCISSRLCTDLLPLLHPNRWYYAHILYFTKFLKANGWVEHLPWLSWRHKSITFGAWKHGWQKPRGMLKQGYSIQQVQHPTDEVYQRWAVESFQGKGAVIQKFPVVHWWSRIWLPCNLKQHWPLSDHVRSSLGWKLNWCKIIHGIEKNCNDV